MTQEPWPGGYPAASIDRYVDPRTITPDGEPLASWGLRVGAYIIDKVIETGASLLIGAPFLIKIAHGMSHFSHQLSQAQAAGTATPSAITLLHDIAGPLLVFSLISLAIDFLYYVGMLRWRQATVGKLALGLRVRRREAPGPLPMKVILLRWVTQDAYAILGAVPGLGSFIFLYPIIDDLFPLWDSKRQALHDKAAGTNVVRAR